MKKFVIYLNDGNKVEKYMPQNENIMVAQSMAMNSSVFMKIDEETERWYPPNRIKYIEIVEES